MNNSNRISYICCKQCGSDNVRYGADEDTRQGYIRCTECGFKSYSVDDFSIVTVSQAEDNGDDHGSSW